MNMETLKGVKQVLGSALELGDRAQSFEPSTPLFGSLPEFDSMAVMTVVLELEERFDIAIDAEEIDEGTFESVGSLHEFVASKLADAKA